MKLTIKRILSLILCMTMVVGCVGCGTSAPVSSDAGNVSVSESTAPATAKTATITVGDKALTLEVTMPDYLNDLITLETMDNSDGSSSVLFTFAKGSNTANIGSVTVFTTAQYQTLKPAEAPVPSQLFTEGDYTVAFQGLQSAPFDAATEEGKLIDRYQTDLKSVTDSIKLVIA